MPVSVSQVAVLYDKQSSMQSYLICINRKKRKATNPHILQGGFLAFLPQVI